jgi:hypothetical protein
MAVAALLKWTPTLTTNHAQYADKLRDNETAWAARFKPAKAEGCQLIYFAHGLLIRI